MNTATEDLFESLFVAYLEKHCDDTDKCNDKINYAEKQCGFKRFTPEICKNGLIRAKPKLCEKKDIPGGFCNQFSNTMQIVLGVVGGLALLVVVVVVVFCFLRKRKNKLKAQNTPVTPLPFEKSDLSVPGASSATSAAGTTEKTGATSTDATTVGAKKNKKKGKH